MPRKISNARFRDMISKALIMLKSIDDLEAGELSGGTLCFGFQTVHTGRRRSRPAPFPHRIGSDIFPLEYRFNAAVGEVPDPAGQTQRTRLLPGVRAEADPLDTAGNPDMVASDHCSVPFPLPSIPSHRGRGSIINVLPQGEGKGNFSQGRHLFIMVINASSSRMAIPSRLALSSLEPAASPATT